MQDREDSLILLLLHAQAFGSGPAWGRLACGLLVLIDDGGRLLPVHIAFLEPIIDPSCTLVFEAEEPEADVMRRPPRNPAERLFSLRTIALSILQGVSILAVCLAVFFLARRNHAPETVRALTFATLVIASLVLIAVNRSWTRSLVAMLRVPNAAFRWVVGGTLALLALVLLVASPLREHVRSRSWIGCLAAGSLGYHEGAGGRILVPMPERSTSERTRPACTTIISGFHQDPDGDWVADLACGHSQHARHRPPWQDRPWVQSEAGREAKIGAPIECPSCEMPRVPEGARERRRTASFTEVTVPAGLLQAHRTKAGVWVRVVVEAGELEYTLEDPRRTFVLAPESVGVAPPEVPHHVRALGPVRFHVVFLDQPLAGPAD